MSVWVSLVKVIVGPEEAQRDARAATKSDGVSESPRETHRRSRGAGRYRGSQRVPESPRESQRVPESPRESHRVPLSPTEYQRVPQSPTESNRVPQSSTGSQRVPETWYADEGPAPFSDEVVNCKSSPSAGPRPWSSSCSVYPSEPADHHPVVVS